MDYYLIEHCSPTLASIKTANLFRITFSDRQELQYVLHRWNALLHRKGILCICLNCNDNAALIYVVRMNRLQADLSDPETGAFLHSCGYSDLNAKDAVLFLRRRLSKASSFPHEIGVFLGYPLADVRGFIENHGQNFLYCGDWKVYSDPECAVRTFERFSKCRRIYRRLWEQGADICRLTVNA